MYYTVSDPLTHWKRVCIISIHLDVDKENGHWTLKRPGDRCTFYTWFILRRHVAQPLVLTTTFSLSDPNTGSRRDVCKVEVTQSLRRRLYTPQTLDGRNGFLVIILVYSNTYNFVINLTVPDELTFFTKTYICTGWFPYFFYWKDKVSDPNVVFSLKTVFFFVPLV